MSMKPNAPAGRREPAYAQLASAIKQMIASGQYQPEDKIPSESAMSRSYGLSLMTVRQAIGLLVEQGLLRRVHGSGTYVRGPDWTQASFSLDGLLELLNDRDRVNIKILKAGISSAKPHTADALGLPEGAPLITLMRLVSHNGTPFLLNHAYLKFDPASPIVESELNVSSLSGLFSGQGNSFIKKAFLRVVPCLPSLEEAAQLKTDETAATFKIRYTFFDYTDSPVGSGWFLAPEEFMVLSTRIGVWDD
ncbi:MAG: GntR family transcriptional regulator [Candidatus Adiutrix sp.]|jgi:GntR family transcriptional regulator|nr:GntR family transcriptional regulator [Candidatus Adiutrix sp.]